MITTDPIRHCASHPDGRLAVEIALGDTTVTLDGRWLPAAALTAIETSANHLCLHAAGLTLTLDVEAAPGLLVFRGSLTGLPETSADPIPAPDAMVRDYAEGGVPVLRAVLPLPTADAYQRPRWSGSGATLELLTLDPRIGTVRVGDAVEVRLYPPWRGCDHLAVAFALLVAPDTEFTAAWRALAVHEGLPGAHRPEDRAQVLRTAQRPTLFAMGNLHAGNADQLLDWAAEAGFGSVLLHCPLWAASDPTYAPNERIWPGGWPTLRAFVDRARARGLVVGLHTMTTSVADHDPHVTPVPDHRLLSVWSTTLAAGVDANDTTLLLADAPAGLSTRNDYMSYGTTVRVGDELIRYATLDVEGRACSGASAERTAPTRPPTPPAPGSAICSASSANSPSIPRATWWTQWVPTWPAPSARPAPR
jgi:hypothetical protein